MTNNKPLGEWTLNETKAEYKKSDCNGACPFSRDGQDCKFSDYPARWDLPDEPQFTPDEEAALRLLKAVGVWKMWRVPGEYNYLYAAHKCGFVYMLPQEMLPFIKPGQEVKL